MKLLTSFALAAAVFCAWPQARAAQDNAGEAMTAESALPREQAGLDDAVKAAVANLPTNVTSNQNQTEDKIAIDPAVVAAPSKTIAKSNGAEDQPLFTSSSPSEKAKTASTTNLWFRMFGSLALVLVLFGGSLYGFRRWPGSKKISNRARMIEVLSQHHLGPKKSLAVVRVAGEACLVGITDNNISILKTLSLLDDDVPKDAAKNSPNPSMTEAGAGAGAGSGPEVAETLGQKFQKTLASKFSKPAEDVPAYYTRSGAVAMAVTKPENEDDFSMQGLREIVGQKLKTMKEL